jgi:hypothetical protein
MTCLVYDGLTADAAKLMDQLLVEPSCSNLYSAISHLLFNFEGFHWLQGSREQGPGGRIGGNICGISACGLWGCAAGLG